MSLSKYLNEHKAATIIAGVIMILIAAALVTRALPESHARPERAYFTVDDGETWFADSLTNIPPYTKDGKEAVRVHLYKTQGGKVFVAHLQRYTVEAKAAAEQAIAEGKPLPGSLPSEVKRPGEKKWVSLASDMDTFMDITSVRSPDNPYEPVEPVLP